MAEKSGVAPAYTPWKTFSGSFAAIEQACPDPLDHSVWSSQSGGTRSALIVAYKFFGLINEKGVVQDVLRELLATKEADRKPIFKRLLDEKYPKLIELGKSGASSAQLEQAIGDMGVDGSTRRKAISFYLAAADYAGVAVSPHWGDKRKRAGASVGTPSRKRSAKRRTPRPVEQPVVERRAEQRGTEKTVTLRSGGTVTLAATVDLISMSVEDRQWVINLIDTFRAYEERTPTPAKRRVGPPASMPTVNGGGGEQDESTTEVSTTT